MTLHRLLPQLGEGGEHKCAQLPEAAVKGAPRVHGDSQAILVQVA